MIPFTYKVMHLPTGSWYYGVRYAEGCQPSDLWSNYFTSSKEVHKLIKQDGKESFIFEIRKIFKTSRDAINWERRLLRKILGSPKCLNASAFPAVLPEHRLKGHETKRKVGEDGLTGFQRATLKWKEKKHLINPETGNTYEEDRKLKGKATREKPENAEKMKHFKESTSIRVTKNNPMHCKATVDKVKASINKRVADGTFPTTKGRKFPSISEKLKGKQFTLGKKWYNDGIQNFRYSDGSPEIEKLFKGRINLKNSAASKGYKYEVITCPHCGKSGGSVNMKRYHFDKCKLR